MSPEPERCPETGRTLLLLAGELAGSDAAGAREHLEACPFCVALRHDLSEVESAYAALPRAELTEMERKRVMAAAIRGGGPVANRPVGGLRRPLLATAAAAVLFVAGLATGILIARPRPVGETPTVLSSADNAVGIVARDPVQRVRFVADLEETGMTGSTVSELVSLLRVEPNPNVRLAITDALSGADMSREDQRRLLELLSTEPLASLRIEILELGVQQRAPGLDSVLAQVARVDDAATVRRFADRTLAALEGRR